MANPDHQLILDKITVSERRLWGVAEVVEWERQGISRR